MSTELNVVENTELSEAERDELSASIDAMIAAHKSNRQEINRLVFESVAAMTAGEDYERQLANKKGLRRFLGGITGSNKKLQDKINSSRAAAQYASQMTLQKLAEQNLMSFDLIAAVNNKLNASVLEIENQIQEIVERLLAFFKQSGSKLHQLENRVERLEKSDRLRNWVEYSIEDAEFCGTEYSELCKEAKIVCLARDFYDITGGVWDGDDLQKLKKAMKLIDLSPKTRVSTLGVIQTVDGNPMLREKMLGTEEKISEELSPYLIQMNALKKLERLNAEEKYISDAMLAMLPDGISQEAVRTMLLEKYLKEEHGVDISVEIDCFSFAMELLFNLKQSEQEGVLSKKQEDPICEDNAIEDVPPTAENGVNEVGEDEKQKNKEYDVKSIDGIFCSKPILDYVETENFFLFRFASTSEDSWASNSGVKLDKRTGKVADCGRLFSDVYGDDCGFSLEGMQDTVVNFSTQGIRMLNLDTMEYSYIGMQGVMLSILTVVGNYIVCAEGVNSHSKIYIVNAENSKKYEILPPAGTKEFFAAADISEEGLVYLFAGNYRSIQHALVVMDIKQDCAIKEVKIFNLPITFGPNIEFQIERVKLTDNSLYYLVVNSGFGCYQSSCGVFKVDLASWSQELVLKSIYTETQTAVTMLDIYDDWIVYGTVSRNRSSLDYACLLNLYNIKTCSCYHADDLVNIEKHIRFNRVGPWLYYYRSGSNVCDKINLDDLMETE